MPKGQTSKTTGRGTRKLVSGASRQQSHKSTAKNQAQEPVDESQWRDSRIPLNQTINKSLACQLYRLNEKKGHLKGLGFTETYHEVLYNGEMHRKLMYLYQERDIERAAWKLHGGPDKFRTYLDKLRASHQKKYPGKEFPSPDAYKPGFHSGPSVSIVSLAPSASGSDMWATTPALRDLKLRFKAKAQGDEWLWKACNERIFIQEDSGRRDKYLVTALGQLSNYPSRDALPDPLSPLFTALKNILAEAPTMGDYGIPANNMENVRVDEISWEQDTKYYWSQDYLTRIYQALIDIAYFHGTGPEGWAAARWMVYDKYTEWDGLHIYEAEAEDKAYGWLQGRLPSRSKPALEFSIFRDHNHPPAIWAEYNALLPRSTKTA
ncbi:hypothetical protein BKA70DRAFT_1249223 [Coprinopsis sp. MPI-PUGE-AT-0042]|nr:hypothetical protein BKA70DRAFT_1249223 [Coprinopsis sp. MPI-PUGE-AT-0042]